MTLQNNNVVAGTSSTLLPELLDSLPEEAFKSAIVL